MRERLDYEVVCNSVLALCESIQELRAINLVCIVLLLNRVCILNKILIVVDLICIAA